MATDNKLEQIKKKIYSFFRHTKPIGGLAIDKKSLVLMFADKKGKILKKEIVLGMNRKEEIDYYLEIFEEIGISSIAVETHIWSFGRFLEEGDKITIVVADYSDFTAFAIY